MVAVSFQVQQVVDDVHHAGQQAEQDAGGADAGGAGALGAEGAFTRLTASSIDELGGGYRVEAAGATFDMAADSSGNVVLPRRIVVKKMSLASSADSTSEP